MGVFLLDRASLSDVIDKNKPTYQNDVFHAVEGHREDVDQTDLL
jgi:hypothetical protein